MKKSGPASRALSLLLVLIMVFQLFPVVAFAGEINTIASGTAAGKTGVKTETLNQEGAINWPVKIYDYLNDGMLFEYANMLSSSIYGYGTDPQATGANYGGGEAVLFTEYGTDFTCDPGFSVSTSTGTSYTITQHDAVDYVSPQYMTVTKKKAYQNSNLCVGSDYECSLDDIRYMVLVYRGNGISDDEMSILLGSNWYRTPNRINVPDSNDWTYIVVDVKEMMGSNAAYVGTVNSMWLTWGLYSSAQDGYEGLNDGSSIDISHVAFFDEKASAENYGDDALDFIDNPGEYLQHESTITLPGVTHPKADKPDQLLSLRYRYKTENDTTSSTFIDNNGHYGMDLTSLYTTQGHYAIGYNSDTYWTWENGATMYFSYGSSTSTTAYPMTAMNVQNMTEVGGQSYVRLSNSSASRILLSKFREESNTNTDAPALDDVNYLVMVYRTNGMPAGSQYAFWAQGAKDSTYNYYVALSNASGWQSSGVVNPQTFTITNGDWTYAVIDLENTLGAKDTDMYELNYLKRLGLFLPAMSSGQSLDLAYVAYFGSESEAGAFGVDAAAYMNSGLTTKEKKVTLSANRGWNAGNNQNFGMLYASCGGGWQNTYDGSYYTTAGGFNSKPNGYYSYMIGYNTRVESDHIYNTYRQDFNGNSYTAEYTDSDKNQQWDATGTSNYIYFIYPRADMDTSDMQFDGYDLKETVSKGGLFTAGLLEGTLTDDRLPVYRQETVEYIATTLYNALAIPQTDANGNYNYNFVKGSASVQFGGFDLNGDGKLGMVDLNGDGRAETDENSVDLATALRACLNLKFTFGQNKGTFVARSDKAYGKGTYADTLTRADGLKGTFRDCRENIQTCVDAAYFLLNNIFVDNSYNQLQDDFGYMALSGATMDDDEGKFAYVFDAGFTTGTRGEEAEDGYAESSQAAVHYAPYAKEENGQIVYGDGVISLKDVNSKDMWYYVDGGSVTTTRFPFLPIYDNEGDYADESTSYYYCDDGVRSYRTDFGTYKGRNYNYVLASNGEFVYREEDDLFFQFEGDDDVYLFINGQIVLDIGGAHSITSVGIKVGDYVADARAAMADLTQYGYYAGMPNALFDEMIDGAKLKKYQLDSNGDIIKDSYTEINNPYTAAERTMLKRHHRLNLVEGQICQFDFYYMERHGYGANMRIVTNMHVTDSKLGVEKSAYQYGEEIEYGGIIDPASPAEYNFKLTNTGNMKLYNLTFTDDTIGVTLDYKNGLTVADGLNGLYILDSNAQPLDASDLTAVVSGYKPTANGRYAKNNATGEYVEVTAGQTGTHDYVEHTVSFADNDALIRFMKTLEGEGLESSTTTEEITQAGSGLWVDASVRFKGIYYILMPEQVEAGMINNTVYVTATNKADPYAPDCQILRSDATHRAYTSGAPVYFQWANNPLYLPEEKIVLDADNEAGVKDSQLSQYEKFFAQVVTEDANGNAVAHTDRLYSYLSDKYGRTVNYDEITIEDDGFHVNYPDSGPHNFYLLFYLNEKNGGYPVGTTVDQIIEAMAKKNAGKPESEWVCDYAVVRITVYTADVEDSYYVLDYGLKTESLDAYGELFKNDYLFGDSGGMEAKLMGVTNVQPSYKGYTSGSATYNHLNFATVDADMKDLTPYVDKGDADGLFNVNMIIPDTGKSITYDAVTGRYSLTGAGTVRVNVEVPVNDDNWSRVCLYYWYDNGTNNGWPGTQMVKDGPGKYYLDIPGDVTHVIVNNGSVALQTQDLSITAGVESTIKVSMETTEAGTSKVNASVSTVVQNVTAHVSVPSDWNGAWLYYEHKDVTWPGIQLTQKDSNGYYIADIPGDVPFVTINNGDPESDKKQTQDVDIMSGLQFWVDVNATGNLGENGITYYDAAVAYSKEYYTVRAKVPEFWGDEVKLYYWYSGSTTRPVEWPGVAMEGGEGDWYTLDVPMGVTSLIINDGTHQTVDLMVQSGLETRIEVNDETDGYTGKHTASVTSACLTYTPTKFMDSEQSIWLGVTVHATGYQPKALGSTDLNVNKEVQMFKKVTVLPANVVYYEDDFAGITYNESTQINTFEKLGAGSDILSQSVDQTTPYGQDATYQDYSNAQFSGESLHKIQIGGVANPTEDKLPDVTSFTFTGTGFELISRTNAVDSASFVIRVYNADTYTASAQPSRVIPVITQFDNGNDGGNDEIHQVPAVRVDMGAKGNYRVEITGNPTYDFTDWQNPTLLDTYLYIDGLRIFQPIGATNDHYLRSENGATFEEIRTQISGGSIGVAEMTGDQLTVSSGTTTWTEDLHMEEGVDVYEGTKVDSADDYLIQGPNNEAYMVGGKINSALVLYVSETNATRNHALQVAIRGLDYGRFNGTGSEGVFARLQVGVKTDSGYGWKDVATILSGTEQYYTIPYTSCPVDAKGNYQVVLRTVSYNDAKASMVSYTSLKSVGLTLKQIEGIGEATILYYANGMLVSPDYYLFGNIDGTTVGTDSKIDNKFVFVDGQLTVKFNKTSTIAVRREMAGSSKLYMVNGAGDANATAAELYDTASLTGTKGYLTVPAGHTITLKLRQTNNDSLTLSYELTHNWDGGNVTKQPSCTAEGLIVYTCSECGATRDEDIPMKDHSYADGVCSACGAADPAGKPHTIYFRNNPGWSTVNIYAWTTLDGKTTNYTGTWPGTAMTLVPGETDLYQFEIPGAAVNVIFNNSSAQTSDLTIPTDGRDMYIHAEDKWVTYNPNCAHSTYTSGYYCADCGKACAHTYVGGICANCGKSDPTAAGYYLIGYINGANYGCEEDWENLGEYKFVDGKLTVTFDVDSYVFLKTGDNANWYLTETYCTDTVGTFIKNKSEKMFVPGGKEITFTLKANADDTLTLSYTIATTVDTGNTVALNLSAIGQQLSVDAVQNVTVPTLTLEYPTLSFEDQIQYNAYVNITDMTDVVELGMITFAERLTDGTIADAVEVIPGYYTSDSSYVVSSNGIPAKNLGDALYFKVYAKLTDGTYAYSDVAGYHAVAYANAVLNDATASDEAKALMVAMLNYGAAAQVQFNYKTDDLMDVSLTGDQQALVQAYDASMVDAVVKADSNKVGAFVHNGGYTGIVPSVSFEGAFAINYYFTTANTPDAAPTFYYWDAEAYANAETLTAENATGTLAMTQSNNQWLGTISGIAAKEIDQTYYIAAAYTVGDTTYFSPVIAYSLGAYCVEQAGYGVDFGAATAVYGYYAKAYFA